MVSGQCDERQGETDKPSKARTHQHGSLCRWHHRSWHERRRHHSTCERELSCGGQLRLVRQEPRDWGERELELVKVGKSRQPQLRQFVGHPLASHLQKKSVGEIWGEWGVACWQNGCAWDFLDSHPTSAAPLDAVTLDVATVLRPTAASKRAPMWRARAPIQLESSACVGIGNPMNQQSMLSCQSSYHAVSLSSRSKGASESLRSESLRLRCERQESCCEECFSPCSVTISLRLCPPPQPPVSRCSQIQIP